MIRKLIVSILASGSICLLPALGRRETFEHLHLWILFAVGIAAGVGLGVLLSGLLLRSWAYLTLGRYFTWHVAVQNDQRVVRSGPFRFVRHPSYTGALLTYVFTGVFLHAWIAAVIAPVALSVAFRRRIRLEEELLCRTFGEEYEDYRREVGALVPRLIKRKT